MEYARIKGMLNACYGMSVTNNIRDDVKFDSDTLEWEEIELTNNDIISKLEKEKKDAFLSFSYGVWVTAYARYNLLSTLAKVDDYLVYTDTDSLKIKCGYDKNIILDYNKKVEEKIDRVCDLLKIDKNLYRPKDIEGNEHILGVFEHEGDYEITYEKFKTQGAKKYAVVEKVLNKKTNRYDSEISITVSGVPKKAKCVLKSLEEFEDDFVFKYEDTGKQTSFYNENQIPVTITDYLGNEYQVRDKTGIAMVPTSYTLGRSLEYAHLISDESSRRAIYKEG